MISGKSYSKKISEQISPELVAFMTVLEVIFVTTNRIFGIAVRNVVPLTLRVLHEDYKCHDTPLKRQ